MATRRFFNKFNNVYCDVCGKLIPVGEPDGEMKWSRRGTSKGKKWHVLCDGSKLETESDDEHTKTLDYLQSHKDEYQKIKDKYNGSDIDTQDNGYTAGFGETAATKAAKNLAHLEDATGLSFSDIARNAGNEKAAKALETEIGEARNGKQSNDWLTGFAGALAPYLEEKLKAKPDRAEIGEIVKGVIEGALKGAVLLTATTVKLEDTKTGEVKDLGLQHKEFPTLLENVDARLDTWLTGPAGSGKTTACRKIANALDLQFFHVGAMDNEYKLKGFIDAQGRVVNTQFKKWYLEGGVICLDEVDSWLPSATLALNAALDNGHCDFPDGMLERHKDAIAIACANTYGLGDGNTDYVGRFKQDAAFVDRFVQLNWDYDEALETAMIDNKDWVKRVQYLRARARAKGIKVIISPRASIKGAKLLARGKLSQEKIEQQVIRKGMTASQWESIQ